MKMIPSSKRPKVGPSTGKEESEIGRFLRAAEGTRHHEHGQHHAEAPNEHGEASKTFHTGTLAESPAKALPLFCAPDVKA